MNNCDYGHQTHQEIRWLPTGPESNALLCYTHFQFEITWRIEQNQHLEDAGGFDLLRWDSLAIYDYPGVAKAWPTVTA